MPKYEEDPIICTLACFTKLCFDKKERPCFKADLIKIDKFFYEIKEEFPEQFENVRFDTNGHTPLTEDTSHIFRVLMSAGKLYCWNYHYDPYEMGKGMLYKVKKINPNEKNNYEKIANSFYEKLSCDMNGRIGKHSKLNGCLL